MFVVKTVMSPSFLERVGLHRVALLTRSALRTCFRPGVSCVCSLLSHLTTFIDGRFLSALSSRLQSRRGPTGVVHPVGRRYSVQVCSDLPCEEHVVQRLVQRRVRVAAVWSWGLSVTR